MFSVACYYELGERRKEENNLFLLAFILPFAAFEYMFKIDLVYYFLLASMMLVI